MILQHDVKQLQLGRHPLLFAVEKHYRGKGRQKENENRHQKTGKELSGKCTKRHALLMGAQIKPRMEEFALSMAQRRNYAALKDAQIKLSKEEYASSTVHRRNDAAVKVAQIKLRREEFASSMEQRSEDVAMMDAQI